MWYKLYQDATDSVLDQGFVLKPMTFSQSTAWSRCSVDDYHNKSD